MVRSTLTIDEHGEELFEAVCGLDLEGIVAKRRTDRYDARTRWLKIKNPTYGEAEGRRELFERCAWRAELSSAGERTPTYREDTATGGVCPRILQKNRLPRQ
jgi:hypothetical protein